MTLQAYQLAYARGARKLFSDINFEIKGGEALWLAGSNGSGKTSLLRLLCGLYQSSPITRQMKSMDFFGWQGAQRLHFLDLSRATP